MHKTKNIQNILRKEGYESILNNAPMIFGDACDNVFSKFGDTIKEDVIKHVQSISELPSKYLFPYYTITEKIFFEMFGKESEIIIESKDRLRWI